MSRSSSPDSVFDVRCACRFRVSECYGQYNLVSFSLCGGGGREVSMFISLLGKRRKYSIPILSLSFQRRKGVREGVRCNVYVERTLGLLNACRPQKLLSAKCKTGQFQLHLQVSSSDNTYPILSSPAKPSLRGLSFCSMSSPPPPPPPPPPPLSFLSTEVRGQRTDW